MSHVASRNFFFDQVFQNLGMKEASIRTWIFHGFEVNNPLKIVPKSMQNRSENDMQNRIALRIHI